MLNFDNDTAILNVTQQEKRGPHTRLFLPGALVPDGEPIAMSTQQEVNAKVAGEWCNYVRGTINARQESKILEARSRAAVRQSSDGGETARAEERGGTGGAPSKDVPPVEAELVAGFQKRVAWLEDEKDRLAEANTLLADKIANNLYNLDRAQRALRKLQEALHDTDSED